MPETRNSKTSVGAGAEMNPHGEFVTTAMLREMLQVQERMFKSLLQSLLENVNSRLDAVIGTVAELKAGLNICQVDAKDLKESLEFSQRDIDDLKPYATKLANVEADIEDIYDSIDYHMDKLEYLENQSRRNNIRIDGILEAENESWDVTEEKVKEVLKDKLSLEFEPSIEHAHCVGKIVTRTRRRPRTIVCRLREWKQKELIIKSSRRIKPAGIYIKEDLAQETLEKRDEQRPQLEEAKRKGKIAYFVLDKLIVKDKPSYFR